MKLNEGMKLHGEYIIEARDALTGKLIRRYRLNNMLMAINRTIRVQMLQGTYAGAITDLDIKYFALGTGTTGAADTQTQLVTESFRKIFTKKTLITPSTLQTVCSVGAGEANFTIKEIGIFCGSGATASANSGIMLSRVNVDIVKNANIVLNITRNDVITI
jgi:hypothetical protein